MWVVVHKCDLDIDVYGPFQSEEAARKEAVWLLGEDCEEFDEATVHKLIAPQH